LVVFLVLVKDCGGYATVMMRKGSISNREYLWMQVICECGMRQVHESELVVCCCEGDLNVMRQQCVLIVKDDVKDSDSVMSVMPSGEDGML
jgi:hypothetical protein